MEKKEEGNLTGLPRTPKLRQNDAVSEKDRTSKIIGEQLSLGQ